MICDEMIEYFLYNSLFINILIDVISKLNLLVFFMYSYINNIK